MFVSGKATRVRFRRNYSRKTYNTFFAPLLNKENKIWRVGKNSASVVTSSDGRRSLVRWTVQPRGWY